MSRYVALDLGAESGRAIAGTLDDGRLSIEEVHRFPNTPVLLPTGLYWDSLRLYHEIEQGIAAAARRGQLDGIGIDTWGVDFGLLGADGALVDNPRHYRDARNNGILERAFERVSRAEIFAHTGIQFMQLNSLFQLYAARLAGAPALETARRLLFMPDLFTYWLTGCQFAELTIASTSQFYNPKARRWAFELLDRMDLPTDILADIVQPGTRVGALRDAVAQATQAGAVPVYATAGHDTASAVASVPAQGDGWCYISSGTWSLMGVELTEPVIDRRTLELNFTNEVGFGGSIRLLKNIAGLWLLQECRRYWAQQGHEYSYETLAGLAAKAPPFLAVIDPDAFLEPGRLPERIATWCQAHGQKQPETPGEFCRVILESLALRYRQVLENLEGLAGKRLDRIHIVGGGSRNGVLNQFVADATGRRVLAGPAEATATGNLLIQAIGAGELRGLAELRDVVRRSAPPTAVEPKSRSGWDEAYERFCAVRD